MYWGLWGSVEGATFGVETEYFCILFIASMNLFWGAVLSCLSSRSNNNDNSKAIDSKIDLSADVLITPTAKTVLSQTGPTDGDHCVCGEDDLVASIIQSYTSGDLDAVIPML